MMRRTSGTGAGLLAALAADWGLGISYGRGAGWGTSHDGGRLMP